MMVIMTMMMVMFLVQCQATWLYLEPIFSSEDIMAQMPEESRKFLIVDSYWRAIMIESIKDTNCLVVTDQPNMLNRLVEANDLLEDIQHGLNAYLEMKRLYFPRLLVATTLCLKKVPTFKPSATLSNVNRFSNFLHYWKTHEICYTTHSTLATSS